jgi:hypothetical protein
MMRVMARVLGVLTSGGWLLFGILSVAVLDAKIETGLVHMLMPGIALALGVAVAWFWPVLGAILLLVDGLAVLAHPTVRHDPALIAAFTGPVCLCAILFLLARKPRPKKLEVRQHIWPADFAARK